MPLRLARPGGANAFAVLCLLPPRGRDKDAGILALRHQITVLERPLGTDRARFAPSDRTVPAALPHRLPPGALRRGRLPVHPDTVLRRHRDLPARRHAAAFRPERPDGRARRTVAVFWSCARRAGIPAGASGGRTASRWCRGWGWPPPR